MRAPGSGAVLKDVLYDDFPLEEFWSPTVEWGGPDLECGGVVGEMLRIFSDDSESCWGDALPDVLAPLPLPPLLGL